MDMMSYLMGKNSGGGGKGAAIEVVTELPETGEANVIYLVPKETEDENNIFDEYLYINDEWELIGTTDIDLSNYLAKDNITSYTPTSDYNPATKKYVDDAVASEINTTGIFKMPSELVTDFLKVLRGTSSTLNVTDTTFKEEVISFLQEMYDNEKDYFNIIIYSYKSGMFNYGNCNFEFLQSEYGMLSSKPGSIKLRGISPTFTNNNDYYTPSLTINLTWSGDTLQSITINVNNSGFLPYLSKKNNNSYTPTADYNPATKKYVDDSIAAAITTTLGGSY